MLPASLDAHDSSPGGQASLLPLTDTVVQGTVKVRTFPREDIMMSLPTGILSLKRDVER
jgi:hypothetical protein